MQFHTTISLPIARAEQLKTIAKLKESTMADVIDAFIRDTWSSLGKCPELPPFEICGDYDESFAAPIVIFVTPGLCPSMTPEQADEIADQLERLVQGEQNSFFVATPVEDWRGAFAGEKKGRGFILRVLGDPEREGRVVSYQGLTKSIGEDLSRALRAAASEARTKFASSKAKRSQVSAEKGSL